MKKLIFTCGFPRSGKTTLQKFMNKNIEMVTVSADDLRWLVYGQRYFQPGENYVWSVRETMIINLMQQRKTIFIDECNNTIGRRNNIIRLARKYEYDITCMFINVKASECRKRALNEGDFEIIPVIDKMEIEFNLPLEIEGFKLILLNDTCNLDSKFKDCIKEFK